MNFRERSSADGGEKRASIQAYTERLKLLRTVSGHGFSRATDAEDGTRLQPLWASEGVKKSAEATVAALSERRND